MDKDKMNEIMYKELVEMNKELREIRGDLKLLDKRLKMMEDNNKEVGNIMTNHIEFVTDKYDYYKGSLNFIRDKVGVLNPYYLFYSKNKEIKNDEETDNNYQ